LTFLLISNYYVSNTKSYTLAKIHDLQEDQICIQSGGIMAFLINCLAGHKILCLGIYTTNTVHYHNVYNRSGQTYSAPETVVAMFTRSGARNSHALHSKYEDESVGIHTGVLMFCGLAIQLSVHACQ
jgi:hypothetical protein